MTIVSPNRPQQKCPHQSLLTAFHNLGKSYNTDHMYQGNIDSHGPIDSAGLIMVSNDRWNFGEHFDGEIHDSGFGIDRNNAV